MMILTLEDWFIFSPRITEILDNHIQRLLTERGVSEQVMTEMPFTIASAHEFSVHAPCGVNVPPEVQEGVGGGQELSGRAP
jgi:hypothetical protein